MSVLSWATDVSGKTKTMHSMERSVSNHVPLVLCVDDDPDLQATLELRMREYRVRYERAFHGIQGFAETVKMRPDVILLDLILPQGDGEHLLESIRQNSETAFTPVIIMTGDTNHTTRAKLMNKGADGFLTKPVEFEDLIDHLKKFVPMVRRTP